MDKRSDFYVCGLDCIVEIQLLKKVFKSHTSIKNLEFDLLNSKVTIDFNQREISVWKIISLINETGLKASLWEERAKKKEKKKTLERVFLFIKPFFSGVFLLIGCIFSLFQGGGLLMILTEGAKKASSLPLISILFYFLSIIFGFSSFFSKVLFSIKHLRFDMNFLMSVAIFGSILIGKWFEGATVAFLFSIALFLESWSVQKARKAVKSLMDLSPMEASLIENGQEKRVLVERVQEGDWILIRPGERIPLDGRITKGATSVNQAPITGESIPVEKKVGDEIYAGTINEEAAIECIVLKKGGDTMLSHIVHLVKKAQAKKAKAEKWVEKFARVYTPIMIALALFIAVVCPLFLEGGYQSWFYRALVVLVIACPCALVISTPVTIVSGLICSARHGVLVKGGVYLEAAHKLKILAVDKTGTLTYGDPEVKQIIPLSEKSEKELLMIAAVLEAGSKHPLARALIKKAQEKNILIKRAEVFQSIKGKGAIGVFEGEHYWIGSHRFMHEMKQETEKIHQMALKLEDAGHSLIAIGNKKHICGLISVADQVRDHIQLTLDEIRKAGVEKIVMLTGDNKQAASSIAKLAQVDHYLAELLPEDKMEEIEKLKKGGNFIAMVGDGVNDAPAMAAAHFGIAMGTIGSDVALETADVALMSDDLTKIAFLIHHSRRVISIVKQNVIFSLAIKAIFFTLTLFGTASLWMAIGADVGASLLVVFNGLRALQSHFKGFS